jgi:hypothetical protein
MLGQPTGGLNPEPEPATQSLEQIMEAGRIQDEGAMPHEMAFIPHRGKCYFNFLRTDLCEQPEKRTGDLPL